MKIERPAETVEACDFCQRGGFLETCDVCEREFCLTCQGIVGQSWGFTCVCRECAAREDVIEVCKSYAEQLTPIFRRRKQALKRIRGNAKAWSGPQSGLDSLEQTG